MKLFKIPLVMLQATWFPLRDGGWDRKKKPRGNSGKRKSGSRKCVLPVGREQRKS